MKQPPKNLTKIDVEREFFVRKFLHADINDPCNFVLILNAEKLTVEQQVEQIVSLIKSRQRLLRQEAALQKKKQKPVRMGKA